MLSVNHIPVLAFESPHQQVLTLFAYKIINKFHCCFRILAIGGDTDSIPAQSTSSAVLRLRRIHSVRYYFIAVKLCVLPNCRCKTGVGTVRIPVRTECRKYITRWEFLCPLLFFVDNPFLIKQSFCIKGIREINRILILGMFCPVLYIIILIYIERGYAIHSKERSFIVLALCIQGHCDTLLAVNCRVFLLKLF